MSPFPRSPLPPVEKAVRTSQPIGLTTHPMYLELFCPWTGLGWFLQSYRDMGNWGLMVFLGMILEQPQRTSCQCFKLNIGGFLICCIKILFWVLQLIWNSGFSIQLHERWATAGEDLPEHHQWFRLCPICKGGWTGWRAGLPTPPPSPQPIYIPGHKPGCNKNVPGAAGGWACGLQRQYCCSSGAQELTRCTAWCGRWPRWQFSGCCLLL